jgi:hypothetical protein
MKILSKIAIGTALLMMVAAALPPAEAACGSPILLDTRGENLISNPAWCGGGGVGCYDTQSGPPVSPNIEGVFWSLGTGNPVLGLGDDSGSFSGGLGSGDQWIKQISAPFTNGLYHYPAFATLKDGDYGYQSGNPVNWSLPVDGCVEANPDPDPCTCMLLTDEWNGVGYFAILGAKRSPNFDLTTGGDIVFAPIPDATIVGSSTDIASADVTVNVRADAPTGGNYAKDGCVCDAGFRVYGNIVTRGSTPPTSRSAGWAPLSGVTAFGGTADAVADCDPATEQDLYLGVAVVGANGANAPFENISVSANSTRIPCGANLADPGRPGRGGKRGTDPRPDRGRDGARGGR